MTSKNPKDEILAQVPSDVALFLEQMREMGQKRNIPNISWSTAEFMIEKLRSLREPQDKQRNIFRILEIGPANGFSTMMLSLACPKAEITSIECSRHAFEELRYNIQAFSSMTNDEWWMTNEGGFFPADLPPKVRSVINQEKIGYFSLYYGDAREVLPAFLRWSAEVICSNPESSIRDIPEQQFDCIFIDGAFRMTREFFDLSRPLLAPDGIIILDDAIKYRWKMEGFHEYLEEQGIAYELVQTDEDDGVMIIVNDEWKMNNE
jgi:predicted O-methyltransferase YrrM